MRITLFVAFFLFGLVAAAHGMVEFGDVAIAYAEGRSQTIAIETLYSMLWYVVLTAFLFLLSFWCLRQKE